MRSTKSHRKALSALVFGLATAAVFSPTASAKVLESGATAATVQASQATSFSPITSAAELYAGTLEPSQAEISYLSWGATADDRSMFANGAGSSVAENVSAAGVTPTNLARAYEATSITENVSAAGVTPTNLARAYEATYLGVSQPDGHQPQLRGAEPLVIRDAPDGFQPQTKVVEAASLSAGSNGFDRGDLALGFGLGLILATAAAITLAMVRDRDHTQMAHS